MKKLYVAALAVSFLAACNKTSETKTETVNKETTAVAEPKAKTYGDSVTTDGAIAAADLDAALKGKDSLEVKVKGEIIEVCQMKGCWVTMKTGQDTMRVRFGEEEFFVPKDVSGKTAIIDGLAYKEVISVASQKHYAEDAGRSSAYLASITKPDTVLTFNALGIKIYE